MINRVINSKDWLKLNHSKDFTRVFINGKLSADIRMKEHKKLIQKPGKSKPEFNRIKYTFICSD